MSEHPRDPSQNARTHGCTARTRFLPGESPADYEQLWQTWLARYHPRSPAEFEFIRLIVDAAWRMQRTSKIFADFEEKLLINHPDPSEWTDDQFRRLQLLQRYKTADINAFHKAVRLAEFIAKSDAQEDRQCERTAERELQELKRPLEERKAKAKIGAYISNPEPVPTNPDDGGCACVPCAWCWGMHELLKGKEERT